MTFDDVAAEAGVSRSLVHAYLGDRRGLLDAVQVRIVARMDTWVGHGLARSETRRQRLRAITGGLFAYVEEESEPWGVLMASGGLDHPALHGVRTRWCHALAGNGPHGQGHPGTRRSDDNLTAQVVVAALVLGVGAWVARGVDPARVLGALEAALEA